MIKIVNLSFSDIDKEIKKLRKKQRDSNRKIEKQVTSIVSQVLRDGDKALTALSKKFDKTEIKPQDFEVKKSEISNSQKLVSKEVKSAIEESYKRIKNYQTRKLPKSFNYKDKLGNILGWTINPIEKIGIYVPGGTASYPSTLLMTATLAQAAGSKEIYVVTPPSKNKIKPSILYAAKVTGVKTIYIIGGAQAIAALAFGTKTIPKVDKIVGPGNAYVATAKKQVFGNVDIDMIAGPSEVLIVADKTADPKLIAADLIAQAEHDKMSQSILVTNSKDIILKVKRFINIQLRFLPKKKIVLNSFKNFGIAVLTKNVRETAEIINKISPEHLEIYTKKPETYLKLIKNAGSIFLGPYSPEAMGDYLAGPNHVLPTLGTAKFSSGLSVYDFIKRQSVIKITKSGIERLGPLVINLAKYENLQGHANSVKLRIK